MRGSRDGFLIMTCGGMLLSWLYAWAAFILALLNARAFSLLDGALVLALATVITMLHRGRGWRIVSIIGVQVVGFAFATSRVIHGRFMSSYSFWSRDWVSAFLAQQRPVLEWTVIVLALFWAVSLWIGGVKLALKAPDQFTVGARFDLGASAFLVLLLIRLIMIGKGAAMNHGESSVLSFLAFFVLGLLALGMVRYRESVDRGYIGTYRGIGVVLSFVIFVLLFGGGLVILFLPSLMRAAELGHDVLKAVAGPVFPVLVAVLRIILVRGCRMAPENTTGAGSQDTGPQLPVQDGGGGGLLEQILTWGLAGLGGAVVLALAVLGVWYLFRWLASRRPADKHTLGIWQVLLRWISLVKTLLMTFLASIRRKRPTYRGAGYLYGLLQRWGARCGLPHVLNETPLEYGSRLVKQFPTLGNEIALIVDLFNQTVYGLIDPDRKQLAIARSAWHRLRSPRLWPARIKSWFISPGEAGRLEG